MGWKTVLSLIFFIFVVGLLLFYWFIPIGSLKEFYITSPDNTNFSINGMSGMQYHENMRFPSNQISYEIEDCIIKRVDDMERAFSIMENKTSLEFYEEPNGQISITCDSETKVEGRFIIAGEGGPTDIIQTDAFNVIKGGIILLLRDSKCEDPNVAIHELLHVLGFNHSENPNNIMYPVSKCDQEIGQDTLDLINTLYSYPSQPDLSFESASASMKGKYLDLNFSVRNNGLKDSPETGVIIYADNKEVETTELESILIGAGRSISFENIFVFQTSVDEISLVIESDFEELDKSNNEVILKIKE